MKILVSGTRDFERKDYLLEIFREYEGHHTLIHGDCYGVDRCAAVVAEFLGWEVIPFPADWSRYQKAAGMIRNKQMLDEKPDLVLAFPYNMIREDSPGTWDCIEEAHRRKIKTLIYPVNNLRHLPTKRRFNPDVPGGMEDLSHLPTMQEDMDNRASTRVNKKKRARAKGLKKWYLPEVYNSIDAE